MQRLQDLAQEKNNSDSMFATVMVTYILYILKILNINIYYILYIIIYYILNNIMR